MSLSLALAVYFICWWVVLFAVLPLQLGPRLPDGTRDDYADSAGAPYSPKIGLKFLFTTLISAAIFAMIYAVIAFGLIDLDSFPL